MKTARGFTLVELLIGLILLTSIVLMSFPILLNYQRTSAERAARSHLNAMKEGILVRYTENSGIGDKEDYKLYLWGAAEDPLVSKGGTPASPTVSLRDHIPTPASCFAEYAQFSARFVASTSGLPPRGGRGAAATTCFLVSKRIPTAAEGIVVPYHTVAVIWPGTDGSFSKGSTFNFETGALKLEGDDRGIVLDGRAIQERKVKQTLEMLRRVRDIYEDYFTVRFLSDPDRTVGRDYFYESAGDDGGDIVEGAMVSTTCDNVGTGVCAANASATLARNAMARLLNPKSPTSTAVARLSASLMSPWGTPLELANRPGTTLAGGLVPEVRSPGAMGSLGQVPFTSILGAQIPGGEEAPYDSYALVTAVGRY